MPTIERGTHRLHYTVKGAEDAPPVLLIMGLSFSANAWHSLPEKLAPKFRVITFDNAGSGKSTAPSRMHMASMADDAAAVLDAAGVRRASVFGISMGGMIAIELALRHPQRVEKLALGCTHAGYWRSKKPNLSTAAMLGLASLLDNAVAPRRLAKFLTSEAHYDRDPEGFVAWLKKTDPTHPLLAMRQMRAIIGHNARDRLAEIRAPTLILTGDTDLIVPAENSRYLAREIRGSRLIEYRGAGHCFPVERPEEVSAAIAEFFSSAAA
jgi:pimeloyl-ACP methyl ester carboxylesterase